MGKLQERVGKGVYKDNCYILVSARQRDMKTTYGEFLVEPIVSFLFDGGSYAMEWECQYGPVQIFYKATEECENKKEHYFFDYVLDRGLDWSQLAVSEKELPQAFARGDYDYIFSVLKSYGESWSKCDTED